MLLNILVITALDAPISRVMMQSLLSNDLIGTELISKPRSDSLYNNNSSLYGYEPI